MAIFLHLIVFLLLLQLLVLEKGRPDSELSLEDIETLLCDDESVFEEKQRTSIIGFPSRPLYRDLSFMLFSWMTSKCVHISSFK